MSRNQVAAAERLFLAQGQTPDRFRKLAAYWAEIAFGYRTQDRLIAANEAEAHAKHYAELAVIHTTPPDPAGGESAA